MLPKLSPTILSPPAETTSGNAYLLPDTDEIAHRIDAGGHQVDDIFTKAGFTSGSRLLKYWKNDESRPSTTQLQKLADVLEVHVEQLQTKPH